MRLWRVPPSPNEQMWEVDIGHSQNLVKFRDLGQLPRTFQLERLDEANGIPATLVANNDIYHQTCRLKYNTHWKEQWKGVWIQKALIPQPPAKEHGRIQKVQKQTAQYVCFFFREPARMDGLHEAATFQIDKRVRATATILGETELLGQLSAGNMAALTNTTTSA